MNRAIPLSVGLLLLLCGLSESAAERPNKVESALSCRPCHESIYEQWKESRHAHSAPADNPLFAGIYRKSQKDTNGETKLFCIRCHAPVSQINGDVGLTQSVTNEGVTCDVCHTIVALSDEAKLWPNRYEPGKAKRGALKGSKPKGHEAVYSSLHATSEICSGCHGDMQDIPGTRSCGNLTICNTDGEWRKSSHKEKGRDCKACHMRGTPGRAAKKGPKRDVHDHRFPGAYFPDSFKDALVLELDAKEFAGQIIATLDITNKGVGHLLPTGPPARLAFVKITAFGRDGSPIWSNFEKSPASEDPYGVFHIVFADAAGKVPAMPWVAAKIVKDTRLRPDETRRLVYKLPAKGVHRLEAKLLRRLAPAPLLDKLSIDDEKLRSAVLLARTETVLSRAK